ncbi:MAG: DUF1460 domain-containing protein [Prevotella sp.]|nr:DUF1460 domain-containing protein [Prevotella sp.]
MNRLLLFIIGIMLSASTGAQPHYTKADSTLVTKLLTEARSLPPTTNMPLHFARKFIGIPYVGHTLEVCDPERLVVNTRQLDCTTLVENVVALTLCVNCKRYCWSDFLDALTQIRYRDGRLDDYTSRLHYFTDWIVDNTRKGVVSEMQQQSAPFTAVQTINVSYMSAHPDAYKALKAHPKMVPVIKKQEEKLNGRKYRYIPKSEVKNTEALRKAVSDGDIIAITCSKAGLDIAHLGFAVWRKDGLHLLNASQLHKKVVEEPMTLGQYLSKHPSHTGIRIIRIGK